jgi:hypothetical protein
MTVPSSYDVIWSHDKIMEISVNDIYIAPAYIVVCVGITEILK